VPLGPPQLLLVGQLNRLQLVLVGEGEFVQLPVNQGLVVDDGEGAGFEGVEVPLQVQEESLVCVLVGFML
jgi:hypothetical protein